MSIGIRSWWARTSTAAWWVLAAGVSVGVTMLGLPPRAGSAWTDPARPGGVDSGPEDVQPGSGWQPGFTLGETEWDINALAVYDDGTGPALYAGGHFFTAGGVVVNRVAKWDGVSWTALSGPGATGVNQVVYALAVYDDGTGPALYAGGVFTTAGSVLVNHVARWDGTSWSALTGPSGTGVSSWVYALAVYDDGTGPALYVGGYFTHAGGVNVNRVARWDGSSWSPLTGPSGTGVSTGVGSDVRALTAFDDGSGPSLYVGGEFSHAGGVSVNNVARWDGSSWSPLTGPSGTGVGTAPGSDVRAITVFDDGSGPALFVGGAFVSAGGLTANAVARWADGAWSPLEGPSGNGTDGRVESLAVFDDGSGPALVAGGIFRTAGGFEAKHIARWRDGSWSPLSGPDGNGTNGNWVNALSVFDDGSGSRLYAGGKFTVAGGRAASNLARWEGTAWADLGVAGLGTTGIIRTLSVWDNGTGPALYAGGDFTTAGGQVVNRVARFTGEVWAPLSGPSGAGVDGGDLVRVYSAQVFDDGSGSSLIAAGVFETAGGVTVNHIARWDGSDWNALAGPSAVGVEGWVEALAVFDDGWGPELYAGGYFSSAGGVAATSIARWNGNGWSALNGPLGTTLEGSVRALAVYDDGRGPALYIGGNVRRVGGVIVHHIVRWDGLDWEPVGVSASPGVDDPVSALAVFDDGRGPALYAGGDFDTADGLMVGRIARWDGNAWSALTGPAGTGVDGVATALTVIDHGSGPALLVGGWFLSAGGQAANHVAIWNGSVWSGLHGPAGTGVDDFVDSLVGFDDGSGPAVFAGGGFLVAGGLVSNGIGKWTGSPAELFADGFESAGTTRWSITVP